MAVPNMYNTVVEVANKYPQEFLEAHTGGARTELWIQLLAFELHKQDPRWGLNGKRGTDVLSQDAVNFKGEGVGYDPSRNDAPITVVDVIGGAGGPSPKPTWQVFNDPTLHRGPGKWIQPLPVQGYHDVGGGSTPVVPVVPPDPNLINAIQAVEAQMKLLTEVNEAQRKQLDTQTKQLTLQTGQLAELLSRTAQNGDDFIAKMAEQVDQQETSNAALKASVDGLNERFDRGFDVEAKAGWPVGNVKGKISLKALG